MTGSRRRCGLVGVGLVLTSAVGCGEDEPPSEDVAFNAPTWSATEELRIGSLDDPDRALTTVDQVAVGPDETLYVPQPQDHEIRVYDRAGALVDILGGEGGGPEEFGSLSAMDVFDDGLIVVDGGNGRVSRITWDGEFLDSHRWDGGMESHEEGEHSSMFMWDYPMAAVGLNDGDALVKPNSGFALTDAIVEAERLDMAIPAPFLRVDEEGALVDTVLWVEDVSSQVAVERGGDRYRVASPLVDDPLHALAVAEPGVVSVEWSPDQEEAPTDSFTVTSRGLDGQVAWSRSYAYAPVPMTEGRLTDILEGREPFPADPGAAPDEPDPPPVDDQIAALQAHGLVPHHHPPITDLVTTQDGSVWLRREDDSPDDATWNVVSGDDGEPLGQVTLPAGQEVLAAEGDLLVVLEEDAFDVPYVITYRLDRAD